MSSRLPKPSFSREHRLGLVVYGGVSLAVYMNGICLEFFNAVRGKGIYKLIKALTDADIIVDVLSGTSAGGINSVLLSYALANSNEDEHIPFEEFAKIWIESGNIKKLLFRPKYDRYYKTSFFDGVDYYKSQLKEALIAREQKETSRSDWVSSVENLDLFVTGTDLLGRIYETFDNTGRIIEVKDHRTVFHLKHRKPDRTAFKYQDEITCEALAKLCQITSCFPGAFPPVTVQIGGEERESVLQKEADKVLVKWGKLRKNRKLPKLPLRQNKYELWDIENSRQYKIKNEIDDDLGKGHRLHFVDGGVLDNRPFSYAIKAIYRRTTERRVFRKLFYVDPSPDRFLDNTQYRQMKKPDLIQVVADSLSALPRYESINNDLELIKNHNEKVRRYKFLLADIEVLLDHEQQDDQNKDLRDQQVYVYKRARLLKLKDKLVSQVYLESEDCIQDFKDEEKLTKKNKKQTINRPQDKKLSRNLQSLTEELIARLDISPALNDSLSAAHQQVNHLLQLDQELSNRRDLDKAVQILTKPLEPDENTEWVKRLETAYQETDGLDTEFSFRKHSFIVDYIHELLDINDLRKWFIQKLEQLKVENYKDSGEDSCKPVSPTTVYAETAVLHQSETQDEAANFQERKLLPVENGTHRSCTNLETDSQFLDDLLESLKSMPGGDTALQSDTFWPIVKVSQNLVKDLNQLVKHIQDINKKIERFFSGRLVARHFKKLIEGIEGVERNSKKEKDFPFIFYKNMCFLHKELLFIEPPPSENIELPKELVRELKIIRDEIRELLEKDINLLIDSPSYGQKSLNNKDFLLERLVKDAANRISKDLNQDFDKTNRPSIKQNEITVLQILALIGEELIEDKFSSVLNSNYQSRENSNSHHPSAQEFLKNFLKKKLKKYFTEFRKLDEFLFPLDYLAGISEKQLIETYRISPEDARHGLSAYIMRGKRLEQKLAGDSLNAFGGFLKQSWRENDILWGQLDGLNRIVECLITDEQIKRFPGFWEDQAKQAFPNEDDYKEKYLDCLLNESLSLRPSEKTGFKQQLKQELKEKITALCNELIKQDRTPDAEAHRSEITKHRAMLVQTIVRAGHLLILDDQKEGNHSLREALNKRPSRVYDITREDRKIEATFREHYKVGSETLQDIPKADWHEIKKRFLAIMEDIIKTYRHKRYRRFETNSRRFISKIEDNNLVRLFVFFIMLSAFPAVIVLAIMFLAISFMVAIPSLLILLTLVIFSLPINPKFLLRYRRPKHWRRLLFKYSLSIENLFFVFLTWVGKSIFEAVLSIMIKWNRFFNSRKGQKKVKKRL